ncbi:oligosaccharide flippase family protein [Thermodesulfobacteriota bacterium]
MESSSNPKPETSAPKRIISRFAHLLSAQGVDGILSALFFLYLAHLDSTLYGEVMYGLAVGSGVFTVVLFGLYYPLVNDLGGADKSAAPEIVNRVNILRMGLFLVAMTVIFAMALLGEYSPRMAWVMVLIAAGFGLRALAETFFADLRVRGNQKTEARIRIAADVISYGYGLTTAYLGFDPVIVSLFQLISGLVRVVLASANYLQAYACKLLFMTQLDSLWPVFRVATVFAFIQILGLVYNKTNIFFLEKAEGVKAVAYYSATYNLIEPISILISEYLVARVIYPLISGLWWQDRYKVTSIVRGTAQWILVFTLPTMFFLYIESDLIIGIVYPHEYKDAIWMQKYLVWAILLSALANLFSCIMMVAAAERVVLLFAAVTLVANLILNWLFVYPLGMAGACLVIILTKLVMTVLTFCYCQIRYRFFSVGTFLFPLLLACMGMVLFVTIKPHIEEQLAMWIMLCFYWVCVWKFGDVFMGPLPSDTNLSLPTAKPRGPESI